MGESKNIDVERARVRWNDIRVVGPLLVMGLLLATLVSPQFATAEQSVGGPSIGGYYPCGYGPDLFKPVPPPPSSTVVAFAAAEAVALEGLVGPCCGDPFALDATAAIGLTFIGDERPIRVIDPCCDNGFDGREVGAFLSREHCEEPLAPSPPEVVRPQAPPIKGPIWLGATQAIDVNGSLALKPPALLSMMIEHNYVEVTNGDGAVVFAGPMPASGIIHTGIGTATGAGDYTMVTSLTTSAIYTEVVSFADES